MRMTINTRDYGTKTFWAPESGGYIRIESKGKIGTLAPQICEGGQMSGSCLSCTTEENFKIAIHKWHKKRLQIAREYGEY